MTRAALIWVVSALAIVSGCSDSSSKLADQIFYGENIITMDSANPSPEAVAIKGDKIVYVGDRQGASAWLGESTKRIELGDRALVPGFIDSHGHLTGVAAMINFINASSPPVGPVKKIDDILNLLKENIDAKPPKEGHWVVAYGYDDSLIAENRHPTRDDLDKVSADIPIYMMHVSGHLGAANSAALAAAGIDETTEDPVGGVFRRYPGTTKPNGVVEEAATHKMMGLNMFKPMLNPMKLVKTVEKTINYYASYGITTIQDGGSDYRVLWALKLFDLFTPIAMDVVAYQAGMDGNLALSMDELQDKIAEGYGSTARLGGVKMMLDGSPQGRTAWLTQPYNSTPDGVEGPYTAYPAVDLELFKKTAAEVLRNHIPLLVHANGDAAIDLLMDTVEEAFAGREIPDHRTVIIHSQVMRPDQVERAARLKMVPSFFASHTFYWGDWHRESFGDERAANISPAQSSLAHAVNFTIHNDTPVVPPDMMRLMWAAVNRVTRTGYILGPDQRISAYDALYSITQGGAYQYFEEDVKGSITVGKQADLVVLGANPLTIDPMLIQDVPILQTIARGKTIFTK